MTSNFLYKISAERVDLENPYLLPFFFQQQKAYSFCKKYCKNKYVLEVGSGSGYGTNRLAEIAKKVIAVDKDKNSIDKCKIKYNRKNLIFINTSAEQFKSEQKFDVVVSLQVIEHIPPKNLKIYLKIIITTLKNKGIFILSTPNAINSSYNENPYHYKEYSADELYSPLSKYFKNITFYSVMGNKHVLKFENIRRKNVLSFLQKDVLGIRRLIPRRIKQILFDLTSFICRLMFSKKSSELKNISEKNYYIIKGKNNKAIDIIAVCYNSLT